MRPTFRPLAAAAVLAAAGRLPAADTPAPVEPVADRPIAYIFGNIPVTRSQLGEFLIARGGAEKAELLVNKMIIQVEADRRGVTVTPAELEAALNEDLEGLSVKRDDFVKLVLPRYNKTLYEWMEDVVRPKLLLTKLARDRVAVSADDLKKQFEREFGEKRQCQIILWPKGDDLKAIQESWGKLRDSGDEFDRAARNQANPGIAASGGHIKPIGRHLPTAEAHIEQTAFKLRPGEVSEILSTSQGYMVMKLHKVLPPAAGVAFDDVRPRLEKQAFDEKMSAEIPKYFADLKAKAAPKLYLDPPADWRTDPAPAVQPAAATAPAAAPAAE